MRILYIITKPDLGGAQRHVVDMRERMRKEGWEAEIATGEGSARELEVFREFAGAPFFVIPHLEREINFFKDILALWSMIKLIRKIKPDIVSLHSSKAGLLGRVACRITGTPFLFTVHGWSFRGEKKNSAFLYFLEKVMCKISGKIICVSEYDKNLGVSFCGEDKLLTIHNGVKDINPELIKKDYSSGKYFHLIMIGRFQIPKDHKSVILAVKKLQNVKVTFVGSGPLLSEIEALITAENLNDRISIEQYNLNIPQLLYRADAFLLVSKFEGLPRSILEAMRAGLPSIVSDVGGCSELIRDGENGFLVPSGDLKALTEKIKLLMEDEKLREKFGKRARKDYETAFTFENMFRKTLNVYLETLKK